MSEVWPGQNVLGKEIRIGFGPPQDDPWRTIVGVVGNTKHSFDDETRPALYVPVSQMPVVHMLRNLTFVARTAAAPANIVPVMRGEIRGADPSLPFDHAL